jgi:mevalonate kinase
MVGENLKNNPEKINNIFDKMKIIVDKAKKELENKNWKRVGGLMNENQELLRQLNVSSKELENLISSARKAGTYGGKLSGAGGGDCMITLATDDFKKEVIKEIENFGGRIIDVTTNDMGIKIEY